MAQRPTRWRRQSRGSASSRRRRGGAPGGQLIWLLVALGFILWLGLGEPLRTLDHALALFGFQDKDR